MFPEQGAVVGPAEVRTAVDLPRFQQQAEDGRGEENHTRGRLLRADSEGEGEGGGVPAAGGRRAKKLRVERLHV